jgi:hypothetical protein
MSLPSVVCRRTHVFYLQLFVGELMSLPPVVCRRTHVFYLQLFVGGLMSLPPVVCRRTHVFYLQLFVGELMSLPPAVCRRAHVLFTLFVFVCVLMSTTYCVVFLFCFSSSCVPYVASFSGLPIFDCPFSILQHLCIAHTNVTWWYCVHLNEKNRIFYKFRKEIFK